MLLFIGISSFLGKNFRQLYFKPFVGTYHSAINKKNESDNLIPERLDIRKKEEADFIFKKYLIDTVVLAAAQIYPQNKNVFLKINVEGVKNVIESMRRNGVKRIVYIGTAVLELEEGFWGEYGKTKQLAEKLIKDSGLEYIILRPTEIYGKYEKEGIGKLIRLVKKYPFFPLINNGRNTLSPIKAEDVCRIIIECLENNKYNNRTYLLCGGEKISFKNLILKIGQALDKKIYFIPIPNFLFQLVFYCLSFCFDKDQIIRALHSKAHDQAYIEDEFDYKFKKIDFSYLRDL